jgi:MoaA/NifB/PqqE/SkfB family radical SAM enzyme
MRHPDELNYRETEKMIREAKELGLEWVYTCGLGEPLEDIRFRKLIELLSNMDVGISLFTNGILIDKEKANLLHDSGVCIILKLDTFDETKYDKILGIKGCANRIYSALNHLLDAGYGRKRGEHTELAFSIVPTQLSYDGIEDVITFAKENNIFPSIGELEQAGRALENGLFSQLAISMEQKRALKKKVDELLWSNYKRPICPAIITGVHIDHTGHCVADRETGLNCKWFLLCEPLVKVIGSVKSDRISDLYAKVREYRRFCFENNKGGLQKCESTDYVFGGCGGNPKDIIKLAKEHL